MDRRKFVKKIGVGIIGAALLPIVHSCNKEIDDPSQGKPDAIKKVIKNFLEQDNVICYENYPNLFLPDRKCFIINDYEFITDKDVLERKKIDFYIKLNVLAVLNSDYKILSFENKITATKKVGENQFDLLTDIPEQTLNLRTIPMISANMFVPIRINKTESTLVFDKFYRLPCFMRMKTFKNFTKIHQYNE